MSVTHSFRDSTGKPRNKTVKSLGYLDEIEKQHPHALAWCQQEKKRLEDAFASRQLESQLVLSPATKLQPENSIRKNLGYLAYKRILQELEIEQFLRNRASRKNFSVPPFKVFSCILYSYLVYERGWRSAWQHRQDFFENFDFSLEEMFQTMAFIAENAHALKEWLAKHKPNYESPQEKVAYLPVVNFFFEDPYKTGASANGGASEQAPEAQKGTDAASIYRQFDPIVQVSLLLDAKHYPLDYEVFFGHEYEARVREHIRPDYVLEALMDRNPALSKIIVIADKGAIASNDVVHSITKQGGYIFGQSPRNCEPETREWIVSPVGYTSSANQDYREKMRVLTRRITFGNGQHISRRIVPEKQIALWSRFQQGLDRAQRASTAATLFETGDYNSFTPIDLAFHMSDQLRAQTQSIDETFSLIDSGLLFSNELFVDGYKMITSSETHWPNKQIVASYQLLKSTHQAFSSPVSGLLSLPEWVQRETAVRAHFALCFTAQIVLETIRARTKYQYSSEEIASALQNINGTELENNWYVFDYNSPLINSLGSALGIDFSSKYLSRTEIRSLLAHGVRA